MLYSGGGGGGGGEGGWLLCTVLPCILPQVLLTSMCARMRVLIEGGNIIMAGSINTSVLCIHIAPLMRTDI